MAIILTLLNLLCISILLTGLFGDAGTIKISILTVTVFSFLYVIASGLFFWLDVFSFTYVLGAILIIIAPLTFFLIGKNVIHCKQMFQLNLISVGEIILVALAFLLSFQNFELYNSGQDQGLYQAEAIELYMGNYEVEHNFEEYQILEREEDRQAYLEMLDQGILGYYPLSQYYSRIGFKMSEPISDTSGMYHGVQTFPAIMALGGKLFGLENMMQVQTIFLICSALLLYYALYNMGIATKKRFGALAVFLLSPLVLWISKTAFTEMLLTLCMSFYLFSLTEGDTRISRYLLALPLVAFPFVHVSFLQIYPIFMLIHVLLFFQNGRKEYIWVNVITSVGLAASYSMMAHIAPKYFFENVARLYYKNIITIHNFMLWIYAGCILVSVCSLLLLQVKDVNAVYQKIISICKFSPILIFVFLGVILYHIVVAGGGFINALSHSAIYTFAMATGFLSMLCVLWYVIRYHGDIWSSPIETAVYFMFLYCILFQSAFIRKDVSYYYYYSRYLVFYVPIICIAFALLFMRVKGWSLWAVLVLSVVVMIGYDVPLLQGKDQTWFEWETLEDLDAAIQDNSAIVLDSSMTTFGPFIRATTGEAIFPVFDDAQKELKLLDEHYSHVYYLSSEGQLSSAHPLSGSDLEIMYRDRYSLQNTETREGHFPLDFLARDRELILYKVRQFIFDYSLNSAPQGFAVYGFSGIEYEGRWTCENEAGIDCYLPADDLFMTVDVASIPLNALGLDSYTANVRINGIHIGDIVVTANGEGGSYQFEIPKKYLFDGANTITINCKQLWSPSDYGSKDSRKLGVFVKRVVFTPAD